jgi:hypothetical protein
MALTWNYKADKSQLTAEALRKTIQREKKTREQLLRKGYKATQDEDKSINSDWEVMSLEKPEETLLIHLDMYFQRRTISLTKNHK